MTNKFQRIPSVQTLAKPASPAVHVHTPLVALAKESLRSILLLSAGLDILLQRINRKPSHHAFRMSALVGKTAY